MTHTIGTTSAYAENTDVDVTKLDGVRTTSAYAENTDVDVTKLDGVRTTSAYAENTTTGGALDYLHGNYLRVRGEYSLNLDPGWLSGELPPRTRRIRI